MLVLRVGVEVPDVGSGNRIGGVAIGGRSWFEGLVKDEERAGVLDGGFYQGKAGLGVEGEGEEIRDLEGGMGFALMPELAELCWLHMGVEGVSPKNTGVLGGEGDMVEVGR